LKLLNDENIKFVQTFKNQRNKELEIKRKVPDIRTSGFSESADLTCSRAEMLSQRSQVLSRGSVIRLREQNSPSSMPKIEDE